MDAEHAADEGGRSSNAAEAEPPEPRVEDDLDVGLGDDSEARVEIGLAAPVAARAAGLDLEWIANRLDAVLGVLDREHDVRVARVTVRVVDDVEMDVLHRRHSGIAGTTDVLTFVEEESGGLGIDLVACLDEAARRTAELGHDPAREILLYAVHGVLHGLGHDDHEPEAHARMHAEEDRLLGLVGVGPVYDRGGDA